MANRTAIYYYFAYQNFVYFFSFCRFTDVGEMDNVLCILLYANLLYIAGAYLQLRPRNIKIFYVRFNISNYSCLHNIDTGSIVLVNSINQY